MIDVPLQAKTKLTCVLFNIYIIVKLSFFGLDSASQTFLNPFYWIKFI